LRDDPEFQGQVRTGHFRGAANAEGFSVRSRRHRSAQLVQLDAAARLSDLTVPPGNRLEALRGDLRDYHSIRINGQWRIIFRWTEAGPEEVEIVDHH
jgi:proteic killer suppression protein